MLCDDIILYDCFFRFVLISSCSIPAKFKFDKKLIKVGNSIY